MSKTSALRLLLIVTGISALSVCIANVRVQAAYEAYLKIEGLDGGSKDPGHVGWIGVARVVSGELNGDSAADRDAELVMRKAGSGGGAGKVKSNAANESVARDMATGQASGKRMHKPLVITKEMDSASPKLYQACATGKHFPSALVETGGKQYKLFDVVIASVQKSSGGERPMETITLNFTKIEVVH
ncbi:MAG: type VI secretion system tube protein Hcp [Acidobacteriota bacterium]|nr:type VI secretion system tube protein Hcp [Acidobacteriota bacterium]MDE3171374.1 type VI secretion system tube protein Hcp [Acidobacteriota bacterium]